MFNGITPRSQKSFGPKHGFEIDTDAALFAGARAPRPGGGFNYILAEICLVKP
jgi:hypothetical protein